MKAETIESSSDGAGVVFKTCFKNTLKKRGASSASATSSLKRIRRQSNIEGHLKEGHLRRHVIRPRQTVAERRGTVSV